MFNGYCYAGDPRIDCDDNDATIYPCADDPEGDGIDQNCDGSDGLAAISSTSTTTKLGPAGQRSKLEAYVKLVGPDGPHADEARSKLAAFREDEASNKLGPLRTLLSASGTTLEDKRRLVSSFVTEFGGTRAASEAQALLSTAEEKAAAAQADQEQKSASGRGGVTWIRSGPAAVSFTKSEVTVAQYEACVRAGTCSDYHLDGYYRRTPSCPSRDASRAA